MKNLFFIALVLSVTIFSCKKDDKEIVENEPATTVTDIDGNVYHTIVIGTQTWMVENLKTTKYRNGDPITHITDGSVWNVTTTEAYCDYDNNTANVSTYGRLYNWYAVSDNRKIAPAGWHVPSNEEFTTLINYLGGNAQAYNKLKESGTTHWAADSLLGPNAGTNSSGFLAVPGGLRGSCCPSPFQAICTSGYWWTSSEYFPGMGTQNASHLYMLNSEIEVKIGNDYMLAGMSVRCIKD